ncbi:polynucleotide adenylyltransferase PcnB [Exilibacterium tricleocarpae]|uniref:Poly(A) polymerase I n=1 Tax=Exilibacterium tricleocarpae TaxID=2591008 RepID=A0A545STK6_9GAMM|nr:polynucleotide adenylyltransferase PcnB [Exilibacterium tricleocarpae]TQV68296.1 polynucleotide adenylyltransferase PcnB [Exilibacterium tricleocarpae]
MLKRLYHSTKKLYDQISNRSSGRDQTDYQIIPRDQHSISRKHISASALKVIKRLHEAGFEAYLVGGGVRDLLLGGHPKDFDVATDATPEQVKRLFRSSRIIGRRFRIVHVRFGREIIEVTTFRAHHEDASGHQEAAKSDQGMLTRDNVYGDIQSDAARRDFSINALYYTPKDFSIHDYTGGINDIEQRLVRVIGDPETRYQEDPVRMLRALRFAAKLDFDIAPDSATPIRRLGELLRHIPPARMFEEVLKLFMGGHAAATFELLREYNLLGHLFPATDAVLTGGDEIAGALVHQAMRNTDHRIQRGKRVTPAFIYAALLWPALQRRLQQEFQQEFQQRGEPSVEAQQQAMQAVISAQLAHTSIPKRFLITMREIWDLQWRLPRRQGKRAERLLEHPRFRAAYDFVLLREEAGEDLQGLGEWWTRYQDGDAAQRSKLQEQLGGRRAGKPRRRRRRPAATPTDPE